MENSTNWTDSIINFLPEFAGAIAVLIGFYFIGKLVRSFAESFVAKLTTQRSVISLSATLAHIITILIGGLVALRIMNLDGVVTSILAGAGIIGLALGFAFQDIASNFISGVAIAVQKQLNVGDLVEIGDTFGIIKKIELRVTTVQTLQGQMVLIPNKDIFTNKVIDYSMLGERRVDLSGSVSYNDDLEKAKKVALKAVSSIPGVISSKPIDFYYETFADSSINFVIRYWVPFKKQPDFLEAQSQGILRIKKAFDAAGITIPFPIRTLDLTGAVGGETLSSQLKKSR